MTSQPLKNNNIVIMTLIMQGRSMNNLINYAWTESPTDSWWGRNVVLDDLILKSSIWWRPMKTKLNCTRKNPRTVVKSENGEHWKVKRILMKILLLSTRHSRLPIGALRRDSLIYFIFIYQLSHSLDIW